jgi:hypothetical protein
MSDKHDKTFKQYAIIGGCLGVLTGVALLVLVLTLAPTNTNINAYYNPEPSGNAPWLGCTTTIDSLNISYSVIDEVTGITTNYTIPVDHATMRNEDVGHYDLNGDRI